MANVVEYGPKKAKTGLPVNIIGQGFAGLTNVRVRFGQTEVPAPATQVKNDQHVKTEVPALPDGPVALILSADGIADIFVGGFTIGDIPDGTAITDVFPDTFAPGGGDGVSVFGYGFKDVGAADAVAITCGSATAQGTAVDSTLVRFTAPPKPPRGQQCFQVVLTFTDGTQAVSNETTCYV